MALPGLIRIETKLLLSSRDASVRITNHPKEPMALFYGAVKLQFQLDSKLQCINLEVSRSFHRSDFEIMHFGL